MSRAVVVGSGPNGLAAAIALLQGGVEVEVREAAVWVGGGLHSAELTQPGFVHDVCASVLPLALGSPFLLALELDVTFSRAHAGLSFTHFQNGFLGLTPDHDRQIELAFETAALSLSADDHDPAAHWAMGRALWLRGAQSESVAELERSVELSPNFALGHYTLGFVHSQLGDPRAAIDATNHSRQLSPFDPLQFAMLASRAPPDPSSASETLTSALTVPGAPAPDALSTKDPGGFWSVCAQACLPLTDSTCF